MFQDPFYAGFYCYGDLVVDMAVDPKFKPMVSPTAFLTLQKINRGNPRGWKNTSDFRPFNDLVICSQCNNFMTPGISTGRGGRYLNITCGNSKCKKLRKEKGITPISNTIRGKELLDYVCNFLENDLKVDRKTYEKAKRKYLEENLSTVKGNREKIRVWRTKVTKLESEKKKMMDRLFEEKQKDVGDDISNQCNVLINEIRSLEKSIKEYEINNSEIESIVEMDFPDYNTFLNFFKNIVTAINNTDDAYLIDQLVKLVFLNITVGDKKVLKYTLNEPFKTYKSLKLLSGVDDGT